MEFISCRGQALVEFVIGVGTLILFLVIIPVFGDLLDIRLHAVEAADYVLWKKISHGTRESDIELSKEVEGVFFQTMENSSLGGAPSQPGAKRSRWRFGDGQDLTHAGAVIVKSVRIEQDLPGTTESVRQSFELSPPRFSRVLVMVKLNQSDKYDWLPPGLSIWQCFTGGGDAWSASGPREVIQHVEGASRFFPYPVVQKGVVSGLNSLLDLVFGEVKLRTNLVKPDFVPQDRLERYVD